MVMGLFELILLSWRRRYLVVGISFLFGVLTAIVALLLPPTYRSEALLVPVQRQESMGGLSSLLGQAGGLAALAGISLSGDDQTAEAIAVLQSRNLTEQFISDQNLMPILFPRAWDAEQEVWKRPEDPPTMGDALLMFDRQVRSVRRDLQSGLVTLRIEWRDRELAAQWANALVDRANESLRRRAIDEANESISYLSEALSEATNVELRSAISALVQNQLESRTLARVRDDFAFRVVDPAIPSDPDKRVRPQRTIMVLVALFVGGLLGLMLAAFQEYLRNAPAAPTAEQ